MTSPQQLDVLDLRHFSARQLRPLLEQEAVIWQRLLRWDYRSSTQLLLDYLDSRILPGFVATYRGRILGFCFCVYEGHKAVIGDLYAAHTTLYETAPDSTQPTREAVESTLSRHMLEMLAASPDISRIEAQLLLFDAGALGRAFRDYPFQVYPRLFLEKTFTPHEAPAPLAPLSADIELCPWSANLYQAAGELIQATYAGHIDAQINDQYRTLAGSLRFLHNVIRFPGCGVFDPEASWLLRRRSTGALAGVLLCSRVAADVAHVTQLSIAPEVRGHGLGKALLRFAMSRLPVRGYRGLTLTVTEANTAAVRLYAGEGFQLRHRFDALVFEKNSQPKRFGLVSRLTSTR